MKNLKLKLIIILVMGIAVVAATVLSTYAIWTESYEDQKVSEIPVGEYNPSEKHIVFVPLNAAGEIISDESLAVSYAAVGYTGLVAELEIPEKHTNSVTSEELNVTHVLVDENHISEAFAGNEVITEIILPCTIVRIGSGVFSNLEELTSVTIRNFATPGDPVNIEIGDYAFMNTPLLTSFTFDGHLIVGDTILIFLNSSYSA